MLINVIEYLQKFALKRVVLITMELGCKEFMGQYNFYEILPMTLIPLQRRCEKVLIESTKPFCYTNR